MSINQNHSDHLNRIHDGINRSLNKIVCEQIREQNLLQYVETAYARNTANLNQMVNDTVKKSENSYLANALGKDETLALNGFISLSSQAISEINENNRLDEAENKANLFYDFAAGNKVPNLDSVSFIKGDSFEIADSNTNFKKDDGKLDTAEYMKALEPFVDKMLELYETDGKAGISYKEFSETELKKAGFKDFNEYFTNQLDSYKALGYEITDDLADILKDAFEDSFKQMFNNWDLDGDGTISQMEFMSTFTAIDAADGRVDGSVDKETYLNATSIAAEGTKKGAASFMAMFEAKNEELRANDSDKTIKSTEEKMKSKTDAREILEKTIKSALDNYLANKLIENKYENATSGAKTIMNKILKDVQKFSETENEMDVKRLQQVQTRAEKLLDQLYKGKQTTNNFEVNEVNPESVKKIIQTKTEGNFKYFS